jgi:hypothetical protein
MSKPSFPKEDGTSLGVSIPCPRKICFIGFLRNDRSWFFEESDPFEPEVEVSKGNDR